jgi:hypothetical protein
VSLCLEDLPEALHQLKALFVAMRLRLSLMRPAKWRFAASGLLDFINPLRTI